jgi:hypothetical protein
MSRQFKPPFCISCGCMISRLGARCQSCCNKYGYKYDECICYSDSPEECVSKLEHYCCCSTAFDTSACRAPEHECICLENPGDTEDCRASDHECICLENPENTEDCQSDEHECVCKEVDYDQCKSEMHHVEE